MITAKLSAVDKLQRLVQWVGDGQPLTTNGNLRLADARYLVETLHTGDEEFAGIRQHHHRVRSSADLWNLQDLLGWAKTARLVKVEHRRLLPVKKNAHQAEDAQRLRNALLKSLQTSTKAYLGRYHFLSYFHEDADLGHRAMWENCPDAGGDPVPVADIADAVWDALTEHDDDPPQGTHLKDCQQLVQRDVTYLLARYADLGVLCLSQDKKSVTLTEFGATWAAEQFNPHAFELRIALDRVTHPKVWRRLHVPDHWTVHDLGQALEDVMGWHEGRGHLLSIAGRTYADHWEWQAQCEARSVTLDRVLEAGQRLRFVYDLDEAEWRHTVSVERRFPQPGLLFPARCVDGAGNCPPEDCDGPDNCARLKQALTDNGPDCGERISYILGYDLADGFDPEAFTTATANSRLRSEG